MRVSNVIPFDGAARGNVRAEAALIGAVLIDNGALKRCDGLSSDDFYEPLHGRIWQRIVDLAAPGAPVSAIILIPHFEDDQALQQLGGPTYLMRLTADGTGLLALDGLVEQIRDLAAMRRAKAALTAAASADYMSRGELLALFQQAIGPETNAKRGATFDLLSLAELENLPAPEWIVDGVLVDDGLAIIYGDPGAGKSFLALDMALSIALGRVWHGAPTKRSGVLYIAGEGARGLGKRVQGWRLHHDLDMDAAAFVLLPVAVQIMETADRAKLLRTIDEAKRRLGFDIGLVVIDTVSRSIAGQDENSQAAISDFVRCCAEIQRHIGGAVLAVHHSGKDRERGIRGSSVFLGALDTSIHLTKDEDGVVTFTCEKQKDAEEGKPILFELNEFAWNTGTPENPGVDLTTLIPVRRHEQRSDGGISRDRIAQAFGMMTDAWADGKPLSNKPQSRESGRYAPVVFALKIGGDAAEWKGLIDAWLVNGAVGFEMYDKKTRACGLRVLDPVF